jgi:hypothetical protein
MGFYRTSDENWIPNTARESSIELLPNEKRALAFLVPLSADYPDIARWFSHKVVPGLRTGTRVLISVERGEDLVGIGIGKREPSERKICTVRVMQSFAGRGIGLRLFDQLLYWLDDDRPHLTVSEIRLPSFERIFEWYGFKLTSLQRGRYVAGVTEFFYNEPHVRLD